MACSLIFFEGNPNNKWWVWEQNCNFVSNLCFSKAIVEKQSDWIIIYCLMFKLFNEEMIILH